VPRWFDEREQVEKWLWNNGGVLCWTEPAPSDARHLCERCGRLQPAAWERPTSSIPEAEPWQSLSHICERCAGTKSPMRGMAGEHILLRRHMKALEHKARHGKLKPDQIEELRWQRCYTCHERKSLRNSWQCGACARAWERAGRPQDLDYRVFANDRRGHVYRRKWLSQRENASDLRLSRVVLYNEGREIELKQFDADAAGLSWRARLQLFRQEVLPMLALPVELTFKGSPTQIVAIMRELVSAESSANQPGNGASVSRRAVDRIPRLAGAVSH
jgi:protein-arginine kinase activator protein McsA